jgi:hypothetical protein
VLSSNAAARTLLRYPTNCENGMVSLIGGPFFRPMDRLSEQ